MRTPDPAAGYRPELPSGMPAQIAALPVHRGYPVPWFVTWLAPNGTAVPRGEGTPDFRVMYENAPTEAVRKRLCWICGQHRGDAGEVFVAGPMCAVNRNSAEPPSHPWCADWAARACPFLVRPHMERRDAGVPQGVRDAPGIMLRRNPGVALLWMSPGNRLLVPNGGWSTRTDPAGKMLFDIGDPISVRWYAEGREATRAEVMASIDSGLPALRKIAVLQPGGEAWLEHQYQAIMPYLPG